MGAKEIGISPQGVTKIRNKLETSDVIWDYFALLGFHHLGIEKLAIITLQAKPELWEYFTDADLTKILFDNPHILMAARIPESDMSHLMVCAFKDEEQLNTHILRLQTNLARYFEIKKIHHLPLNHFFKYSSAGLLDVALDENTFYLDKEILNHIEKQKKKD